MVFLVFSGSLSTGTQPKWSESLRHLCRLNMEKNAKQGATIRTTNIEMR
jgi:hypothetical protein